MVYFSLATFCVIFFCGLPSIVTKDFNNSSSLKLVHVKVLKLYLIELGININGVQTHFYSRRSLKPVAQMPKFKKYVKDLFRHGNRTVDLDSTYPNDPYINETYYPFGYAQLTNKGKQKVYGVGKELRERYKSFLGDVYTPDILDPVSTEYNRTKMSLELLLAGLFPPSKTVLDWEKELNWQPIPYNYLPNPPMLGFVMFSCPKFIRLYNDFLNSPIGREIHNYYTPLFGYLSQATGLNITTNFDVLKIFVTLDAETDWGLPLPNWAKDIYPHTLERAAAEFYKIATFTPELRQLSGGILLKKIIEDTQAKINNKLIPRSRKLFLYSAHDVTIAFLLGAMKVLDLHEPPYAAYISIELHEINSVYGFKIFYQTFQPNGPLLLTIPGCKSFCPVEKFISLLKSSLPVGDDPCRDKKEA